MTVTLTAAKLPKQPSFSQRTLYVVFSNNEVVVYGEPVCKKDVLFEQYHVTVPDTQVAVNVALVPLQAVTLAVVLGAVGAVDTVNENALLAHPKVPALLFVTRTVWFPTGILPSVVVKFSPSKL